MSRGISSAREKLVALRCGQRYHMYVTSGVNLDPVQLKPNGSDDARVSIKCKARNARYLSQAMLAR